MTDRYRGIFVSDLDGTLLRNGRISDGDLRAFRGLRDQGTVSYTHLTLPTKRIV